MAHDDELPRKNSALKMKAAGGKEGERMPLTIEQTLNLAHTRRHIR
ncbi:MAG: hypothetical protein LBK46_05890 [Oscillospiraceae bacterium]|nr:hypothetical protein [Oscillospiraceae bacterium]